MDGSVDEEPGITGDARLTTRLFWLLIVFHVGLWTLAPTISQPNATLDTVEMVLWGHEWQLGYYKHPPLPAWICETSVLLFGPVMWPLFMASQLLVAVCFWAVWRLANEFLAPWQALASVALLETCHYFNFSTIDLNNNMPAKACWALAILFFYWSVTRNRSRDWIALGCAVGMGLLSKYDATLLAATMIGLAVVHPRLRKIWNTPGPYMALGTASLIFLPHLVWLVQHDFLTIQYVRNRSSTEPDWMNHVVHPVRFLGTQIFSLGALFLFCSSLLGWRPRLKQVDDEQRFQRTFLATVVFGPLLLALLASALTGAKLRTPWGSPMFTYMSLLMLVAFQSLATERIYRRVSFASVGFGTALAMVFVTLNVVGPHIRERGSRVHFPGRELASEVERRWAEVSDKPLSIVAGDSWEAGNVALYSEQRPRVYIELSESYAPWTSDSELNSTGGVILWQVPDDAVDDAAIASDARERQARWRTRFPNLVIVDPIQLNWESSASIPRLSVGMAIVPSGDEPTQRLANRVYQDPTQTGKGRK